MNNKWIVKTLTKEQIEIQESLSKELSISPILTGLLVDRGITTFEEARNFFDLILNFYMIRFSWLIWTRLLIV